MAVGGEVLILWKVVASNSHRMPKVTKISDRAPSKTRRQRSRNGEPPPTDARGGTPGCRFGRGVEREFGQIKYRELMLAVLEGQRTSTCPVGLWRHHPVADQESESMAAATFDFQARHDCDFVKVTPASTYQLRDYGLADAWRGDSLGRRWIGPGVVHHAEQWRHLPRLDPTMGFIGRHLACARALRRRLDPAIPVIQTVFNPMFQAACLGGDKFRDHCEQDPESVAAGMEILRWNTVLLIEALVEAGIDGVYLVAQNARAGAMTPEDYARVSRGTDRSCLEAAGCLQLNFLHLHGDAIHVSAAPTGNDCVLHFSEGRGNPDAAHLLAERGRCLSTGPDQAGLIRIGTPEEAYGEAEAILKRLKGPGFLLSSACVVTLDTPGENIDAVIRAARTPRPDRDQE